MLLLVIQVIWNIIGTRFQIVKRFSDKQIFIGNYSSCCQKLCTLQRLNFSLSLSKFLFKVFKISGICYNCLCTFCSCDYFII